MSRLQPVVMLMDENEVTELYMKYIRAFEEKNHALIADVCRTPFFASSPLGTTIFHDREELVNGFASLRDALDVDGYIGSRINHLKFSSIAKTTGTLHVDFDRMDAEGTAYFNGQALYLFQVAEGGLEIIGIAVLDSTTVSNWTD